MIELDVRTLDICTHVHLSKEIYLATIPVSYDMTMTYYMRNDYFELSVLWI